MPLMSQLLLMIPPAITDDPACKVLISYVKSYNPHQQALIEYAEQFAQGKKDYIAGTLEMREGEAIYPDANFTMRLTYGTVLPYYPRDAVFYNYYTTLRLLQLLHHPQGRDGEGRPLELGVRGT